MYGENRKDDAVRFIKAFTSNQLARVSPHLYVKLRHRTGQGVEEERPEEIADYFSSCFNDYFRVFGVEPERIGDFIAGKHILEYGPGDVPGTALRMYARGTERVTCVDHFPLVSFLAKNIQVMRTLIQKLSVVVHERAES